MIGQYGGIQFLIALALFAGGWGLACYWDRHGWPGDTLERRREIPTCPTCGGYTATDPDEPCDACWERIP